jgi:predicted CoA-binding protein
MVTRRVIEEFLSLDGLAVVGASRIRAKFGNKAYRDLRSKGYNVVPMNPSAETIEGDRCFPDLASLPKNIKGLVMVIPPAFTEKVILKAKDAGITHVWMQPGAESAAAAARIRDSGLILIEGQCIMMHAAPVGAFHRFHRFFARLAGKAPK